MASYVLDTGILVGYIRGAGFAEYTERKFAVSQPPNVPLISIVSKGEIYSLAIQFGWGNQKKQDLDALLRRIPSVDIHTDRIIHRYAELTPIAKGNTDPGRFRLACQRGIWERTTFGSPLPRLS